MKIIIKTIIVILVVFFMGCTDKETPNGDMTKTPEDMVYVPAGDFIMGSSEEDVQKYLIMFEYRTYERYKDELPQHVVYLDAFFIDKYEVTNAQYREFVEATDRKPSIYLDKKPYNYPNLAVMGLTWEDADAYARWKGKRLPTEAEWEKAARGTDGRYWPWGNDWDPKKLNANDAGEVDGFFYTAIVGSYPQWVSPYGVHDMAGNVWEWVSDWYDPDYYKYSPRKNPKGPKSGENHVAKGGSWDINKDFTRCPSRFGISPGSLLTGVRCAVSAE